MIPPFVEPALDAMQVSLDAVQLKTLDRYLDLLLQANQRVNLTAVKRPDAGWHRLILDSLTLAPGLEPLATGARVIDVGTGGGLPGLPLAIVRPELRFTLLDATGKKVRAVESFVEDLGLQNVAVMQGRAEDLGHDRRHRERYAAAVTRAVGSVAEVLEYCLPLVELDGRVLIIKGQTADEEVAAAADALPLLGAGDVAMFDGYPSGAGLQSDLVVISVLKASATPAEFPRKPGVPRATPL
jgi:16S rRNA (guanine527-N7)-methyltransferase